MFDFTKFIYLLICRNSCLYMYIVFKCRKSYKSESEVLQYFASTRKFAAHTSHDRSIQPVGKAPAMVVSIEVVCARTRCALLYSMCDLKAAQINVQCSLI